MSDLELILSELIAGVLTAAEAYAALLELGIVYAGALTVTALIDFIRAKIAGGGNQMAAFPGVTPGVCSTGRSQHKGICCTALTQLGAAQAATGFQYTSCTGKTVCMKCGIGTSNSTNPAKRGKPIFIPRRVKCGPSGCPALGAQ